MICIKPLTVVALLCAFSTTACGKDVPSPARDTQPEGNAVVVDPSATPSESATPAPTATPSGPTWLKQKIQPKASVSPGGTVSVDMRDWLAVGYLSSSDPQVTITRIEDNNIGAFRRVLDANGNWVGMRGIKLKSFEPGSWVRFPIWIKNAGGAELRASIEISVVKPILRFSRNVGYFKIRKAPGKLEFNMISLYNRGIIKSSTDEISMSGFKTNLPLTNCEDVVAESGAKIGIRCDKGELTDPEDCYSVWIKISSFEGKNDERLFGVDMITRDNADATDIDGVEFPSSDDKPESNN